MVILVATFLAKPGEEGTIEQAIREAVRLSNTEPGTALYVGHRSTENPREFMLYEQYTDEAALEAHRQTPYFKKWVLDTILPAAESRSRQFYQKIG